MRYFLSTLLAVFVLVLTPAFAFAQESIIDCDANPELTTCQAADINISQALATVIQFIFVIAVILALGFLIYGGIRWITSGGDKGGVENARNTIIASIIGLIIVFLAYVIINLVLTFLTGDGIDNITIPQLGGCKFVDANDNDIREAGECQKTDPDATYSCNPSDDGNSCIRTNG